LRGYISWGSRGYAAPSPHFIKQAVLLRNALSDAVWVETGTYLGQTTRELSKHGSLFIVLNPNQLSMKMPLVTSNSIQTLKYFKD
jgi:hypothetical protein